MKTDITNLQDGFAAYVQLQAFIAQSQFDNKAQLPPERILCSALGVTRGELRKALSIAEKEGQIWRHVGKGTFIGQRPDDSADHVSAHIAEIAKVTTPMEVMRSRIIIEPELCREASHNATSADIEEMQLCASRCATAQSWRHYENWDNRFHRAIAVGTNNGVLLALFDTLNAVRRTVVWGRLRADPTGPGPAHHSHTEHQSIVEAIADRDAGKAAGAMRAHLEAVAAKMTSE